MSTEVRTYYVRHTTGMDITRDFHRSLWESKPPCVAIHFPDDRYDHRPAADSRSKDPDDYKGKAKGAMRCLVELAQYGGYVCAEYVDCKGCLIGFIPGNSNIELVEGKWGSANNQTGRTAVLKAIHVHKDKYRFLKPVDSLRLLIGRPQQGTMSRWHQVGNKVHNLVENESTDPSLDDLLPNEQEALCSEFLRLDVAQQKGLPKLMHLMTSVGRTMKGVDILGIDDKGKPILAQVTYSSRIGVKGQAKVNALKDFKTSGNASLILFCTSEQMTNEDGIIIFPLQEVFNIMKDSDYVRLLLKGGWSF